MIDPKDAHSAAVQLEGYFLRRIMSEVKSSTGGALDGGFAGETFHEMLDGALADAMAAGGGVGLTPMIEAQLDATPHVQTPTSPTTGAPPKVGLNPASGTYFTRSPLKGTP